MIYVKRKSQQEIVEMFLKHQQKDKYYHPLDFVREYGYKNSTSILKALRNNGVTFEPNDKNKLEHRSYNLEVINGNLLGDGYIYYKTKEKHYPVFAVDYKYKKYCQYIKSCNPFLTGKIRHRDRSSSRYKSKVEHYICESRASSVLKDLHNKWYPKGIKIVPRDLVITPTTLLIWFLDDGYRSSACSGLSIATDGFSTKDVYFLKYLLESTYNFNITVTQERRLYIKAESSKDFLDIIGECPVKCYEHKWN